jgi:DNA-binding Lrp family transcriptional regulator
MDELDKLVISELIDDCRKPFRKIAEKAGVSTPTIIKRYNELKKKGIIQLCCIQVDWTKLGYEGAAHLLITSSGGITVNEVMERVKEITGVIIASTAIGDFEGYAVLAFRDIKNLYDKVLQIKSLHNIHKVELSIAVPGMRYFPPKRNPFKDTNSSNLTSKFKR